MRPMPGLLRFMLLWSQPSYKLRMRLHMLRERLSLRIHSKREAHLGHVDALNLSEGKQSS